MTAPPGGGWLLGADAYLAVTRGWLAAGEPERADAVLGPFRAAAERAGWLPLQALAAEAAAAVAAAAGDPATARRELAQARTLAERCGVALPGVARRRPTGLGQAGSGAAGVLRPRRGSMEEPADQRHQRRRPDARGCGPGPGVSPELDELGEQGGGPGGAAGSTGR